MWASLALVSALSLAPAQAGDLKVTNQRPTYGLLGQDRKNSTYLPGDLLFVSFDIENLKVGDDGRISYSMALELIDKASKKAIFSNDPKELEGVNTLGGNKMPAFALTDIGLDTPEGKYTFKVTIKDRAANKTTTLTQDFEVEKIKFGITRVGFTYDGSQGVAAPPLAVAGQTFNLMYALVGFETKVPKDSKDPKNKQPDVVVEVKILEDGTKETLKKPFIFPVSQVDENYKRLIPMVFTAQLNRAGTYKIVIEATDKHTGKKATQTLDLVVK